MVAGMIDFLSRKTASGDLYINLAVQYLGQNEWGMAKKAVEDGFAKGCLSEPEKAQALLEDICCRLGVDPAIRRGWPSAGSSVCGDQSGMPAN